MPLCVVLTKEAEGRLQVASYTEARWATIWHTDAQNQYVFPGDPESLRQLLHKRGIQVKWDDSQSLCASAEAAQNHLKAVISQNPGSTWDPYIRTLFWFFKTL